MTDFEIRYVAVRIEEAINYFCGTEPVLDQKYVTKVFF